MNTNTNETSPTKEDLNCTEAVDYVNQLIARMNGDDEPVGNATEPLLPTTDTVKSRSPTTNATDVSRKTESELPSHSAGHHKKAQRPIVMAADLQRLREAVNISTTRDLNSLDTITLFRTVYSYILLAVILISTSLTLVTMTRELRSMAYVASVIAVIVASMATWKYMKNVSRLSKALSKSSRLSREIPAL